MIFDIITIFPTIFDSYLKESLLKRAQERGLITVRIHNLRDWTTDKHKSVDDKPYGGGLGMVMKLEPIFKAVTVLKKSTQSSDRVARSYDRAKTILFTPRGKKFNQRIAYKFSKLDQLIMICGRYEGVDERVAKRLADEQISIGDYDLMGGELPAMVVVETVTRLIPGVVGKPEFLDEHLISIRQGKTLRRAQGKGFIEYPQYTRPEVFESQREVQWRAPKVLLSGNHKKIESWRAKHGKIIR